MRYDSLDAEAFEALADEFGKPPSTDGHHEYRMDWRPFLNPSQEHARNSQSIFILLDGERGSGKTVGALHLLVEHCVENQNALGLVLVKEVGQATDGGAWHKLITDILPTWRDGNREPLQILDENDKLVPNPAEGELMDDGMGIVFSEPHNDNQTKKPFIWILNKFGSWSMIMLISLPVDSQVMDKIKGKEPSFIVVDEAQTLESDNYFKFLLQQLGRRPHVTTRQKVIYCANPAGPSHWLYQRFFVKPLNTETGKWDTRYERIHVPVSENLQNLPANYYEDYVLPAVSGDDIEKARMVDGIWIDRPTGEALFGGYFSELLHTRPTRERAALGEGVLPMRTATILMGWDPGAAHTCVSFLQIVPTLNKVLKIVFDELNYVGKYRPYQKLVPEVIKRMIYWDGRMQHKFRFEHISDNSAFNQFRARDGSFDVMDIEDIAKKYVADNNLDPRYVIKLKECPKGSHSVDARVRLVRDDLDTCSMIISAQCVKTKEMFVRLEEDPMDPLKPKDGSPFGHPFAALSYPILYYGVRRGRHVARPETVKPEFYLAGKV